MDKHNTNCETGELPRKPTSPSYAAAAATAKSTPLPNIKRLPVKQSKAKGKAPSKVKSFTFAQGQEEPFPGVNFFGVKFVSYHSLLCYVKGANVLEPGFRKLINTILQTWAPEIPAF